MKKLLIVLAMLSLFAVLTVACGSSGGAGSSSSSTAVHMSSTNFAEPSVTISKGSSITLVNDTATTHIIGNGSWKNGSAVPATEPGAPTVSNLQISSAGEMHTVGPFNTAGTYHLYCSFHQNMDLTVTVQ